MKFFTLLLFLFLNFCSFSQTKCPDEIKNFTGICCEFHPNGIISQQKKFKNGLLVGEIKYYDEKGYLINYEYLKDESILNESFSDPIAIEEELQDDIVYTFVEQEAQFPGGTDSMNKFIVNSLKYPRDFAGKVKIYAKFVIEKDGSISGIEILRGIENCIECSEEVIRVLKSMPRWIPGLNNGKKVRSRFQIPFNFNPN
jgi:hypothetical protein